MDLLSDEQVEFIIDKLNELNANQPCPRCKGSAFTVAPGYTMFNLQTSLESLEIGQRSMPVASVLCNNCGFVSQHAIGALGLLPKREVRPEEDEADLEEATR